jgi:hypothetical protein
VRIMVSKIKRVVSLLLLLGLFSIQLSAIGEVRGDYNISISHSSVTVTIHTVFNQNMTLQPTPAYNNTSLSGSNATSAGTAFTSALSALLPGVSASGLTLTSSSASSTTQTTVKFNVEGATSTDGGVMKVNMAWRSFKVTSNITAGGIPLNSVGNYIDHSPVLNNNSSSFIAWKYFADGNSIAPYQSTVAASSFQLLDFSLLSSPLDSWHSAVNISTGFGSTLSSSLNHNITVRERLTEPDGSIITTIFFAGYSHNVQITIPGPSRIMGDTILIDTGSFTGLMAVLVVLFPIIAAGAFFVERNLTHQRGGGRARRNHRK